MISIERERLSANESLLIESLTDGKPFYQGIAAFLASQSTPQTVAEAIRGASVGADLGGFRLVSTLPECDACPLCGNRRYADGEEGSERGIVLDRDDEHAVCLRCEHRYRV